MTAILTVTLNPALDVSTYTESVVPGPKLRCDMPLAEPGGGGVNVSRAIRALGGESTALVALGGATGNRIAQLLADEGLNAHVVESSGETRQSLAVTERDTGLQYRFVMPGPSWDAEDLSRVLHRATALARSGSWVVLSWTLPPGLPDDVAARFARQLELKGAKLLCDTSGRALHALVARPEGLTILRVDHAEAQSISGAPLEDLADTASFAFELVNRGVAEMVILARGAEGNVISTESGTWAARSPPRNVISAIGAGDSFVAGLVMALAQGKPAHEALRHGTAAAAAAVLTPGTELCRRSDFDAILPQTQLIEF